MNAFKKQLSELNERVARDWPACELDGHTVCSADGSTLAIIESFSSSWDPLSRDTRFRVTYRLTKGVLATNPNSHPDSVFKMPRYSFLGS